MIDTTFIADNVMKVHEEIAAACTRAGRDPAEVTLLAVGKTQSVDAILAAVDAGVQHLGENRVEEAIEKIPAINQWLADQKEEKQLPVWHMVGHIQSRKARYIPPLFQVVHSVDRLKIANRLSRLMVDQDTTLDVFVEMNVSGEESKSGFAAAGWSQSGAVRDRLWAAFRQIFALPGLNVRGLMTMAPILENPEQARPVFTQLAALRDALAAELDIDLPELSMGMTDDYPVAIEEGATIVRIGRAIFGPRHDKE